jgi:transcriptional regulator with XRE-family HTH domain
MSLKPSYEVADFIAAAPGDEYLNLRDEILRDAPDAKAAWDASRGKREIALLLARIRKAAGLTQKDIALRTGWDKAFVSRLEGAAGGIPDTQTMSRYAEACGATLGLVVAMPGEGADARIVDAITVSADYATPNAVSFGHLRERYLPPED